MPKSLRDRVYAFLYDCGFAPGKDGLCADSCKYKKECATFKWADYYEQSIDFNECARIKDIVKKFKKHFHGCDE